VTFIHITYTGALHASQKTLHLDCKEVLVLCSEIIAAYCGLENPVPCRGTFVVATAQLTLLPLLFLVIRCISFSESCICSFWYFPGVRLWFADVSEPSVRSIFKGWKIRVCRHFGTLCQVHLQRLEESSVLALLAFNAAEPSTMALACNS
jgi:hypothetical protein